MNIGSDIEAGQRLNGIGRFRLTVFTHLRTKKCTRGCTHQFPLPTILLYDQIRYDL